MTVYYPSLSVPWNRCKLFWGYSGIFGIDLLVLKSITVLRCLLLSSLSILRIYFFPVVCVLEKECRTPPFLYTKHFQLIQARKTQVGAARAAQNFQVWYHESFWHLFLEKFRDFCTLVRNISCFQALGCLLQDDWCARTPIQDCRSFVQFPRFQWS